MDDIFELRHQTIGKNQGTISNFDTKYFSSIKVTIIYDKSLLLLGAPGIQNDHQK